jgi:hypothetical protein
VIRPRRQAGEAEVDDRGAFEDVRVFRGSTVERVDEKAITGGATNQEQYGIDDIGAEENGGLQAHKIGSKCTNNRSC